METTPVAAHALDGDDTLTFTAVAAGVAGNGIDVIGDVAGSNTPLSLDETADSVTVHIGTDGGGAAVSTVAQVAAIINSESTLVTATYTDGALIPSGGWGVTLAGGRDAGRFEFDPTGKVTITAGAGLALEIVGPPGSKALAGEVVTSYNDEGDRLWGLDGAGQQGQNLFEQATAATSEVLVNPAGGGQVVIFELSTGTEGVAPAGNLPGGAKLRAMTTSTPARLGTASADVVRVEEDGKLGFFDKAPVAQPTGVAVSAPGIHAALVALGLITA